MRVLQKSETLADVCQIQILRTEHNGKLAAGSLPNWAPPARTDLDTHTYTFWWIRVFTFLFNWIICKLLIPAEASQHIRPRSPLGAYANAQKYNECLQSVSRHLFTWQRCPHTETDGENDKTYSLHKAAGKHGRLESLIQSLSLQMT